MAARLLGLFLELQQGRREWRGEKVGRRLAMMGASMEDRRPHVPDKYGQWPLRRSLRNYGQVLIPNT